MVCIIAYKVNVINKNRKSTPLTCTTQITSSRPSIEQKMSTQCKYKYLLLSISVLKIMPIYMLILNALSKG